MLKNKKDKLVKAVIEAWTNEGPRPEYHTKAKIILFSEWPTLAKAISRLAEEYDK